MCQHLRKIKLDLSINKHMNSEKIKILLNAMCDIEESDADGESQGTH